MKTAIGKKKKRPQLVKRLFQLFRVVKLQGIKPLKYEQPACIVNCQSEI